MSWFENSKKMEAEAKAREEELQKKLKEEKDAREAAEARMKSLETERTQEKELVTKMSNEFEEVKKRLAAAEGNRKPDETPEELADFVEEPDKAFNQRVSPLAQVTIQNAMQTSRILAQQQLDNEDLQAGTMNGRLFRAWGAELDREAKKYAATALGTPNAWLGMFYYIKGLHSEELSNPDTRKQKYSFLESGRSSASPPPPDKKTDDQLTEQERHIAERMGVSPENYLKRKKQLRFSGA
jgi:hypothetical protein